jgi:hypothetical protein
VLSKSVSIALAKVYECAVAAGVADALTLVVDALGGGRAAKFVKR